MTVARRIETLLESPELPAAIAPLLRDVVTELDRLDRQASFFADQWRFSRNCEQRYVEAEQYTRDKCGQQVAALKGKILGLKAQIASQEKGIRRLQRKLADAQTKLIFADHKLKDSKELISFLRSQAVQ